MNADETAADVAGAERGWFRDSDGRLRCDGHDLEDLAARHGTPLYLYSEPVLSDAWRSFSGAVGSEVSAAGAEFLGCYSLKSNPHLAVVSLLRSLGAGADLVSVGELSRALSAGVRPDRMVFAGVAKRDDELRAGLDAGILQFNAETASELASLESLAAGRGVSVSVALRFNPDIAGGGNDKISTGRAGDKFGLSGAAILSLSERLGEFPHLDFAGLSLHIGSQLESLAPFRAAWGALLGLFAELQGRGLVSLRRADLGGGLGVAYGGARVPSFSAYAKEAGSFARSFAGLCRENGVCGGAGDGSRPLVLFEPGRCITAHAGGLLTRVVRVKEDGARRFVLLDAGMNDLVRPSLYGARHELHPVRPVSAGDSASSRGLGSLTVAGPICESGDTFARDLRGAAALRLAGLGEGDLALFSDAGAYGATMSSLYNTRPAAAEVLVRRDEAVLITPRGRVSDALGREFVPRDLRA